MKKIQEIAPYLADIFIDFEQSQNDQERYRELYNKSASRLGKYFDYLPRLHDCWFIETKLTKNRFEMKLNDFTTHVFADALIKKKKIKIDEDKLIFPLSIDFEITNLTFNKVDEDTGIITEIEPTEIHEYLYEEILSVDTNNIELAIVVWKENMDKAGEQILILLSVKEVILTEFQDEYWQKLFGNKYSHYYQYFKSQLGEGRYLSDQSLCEELIEEYENKK